MINNPINRWWTVVAGVAGSAVGSGTTMVYAYGILAASMSEDLHWDRAIVGGNLTAFLIGSGLGSVSLGWLIARYGIRRPAAIYAATFGLLFAAAAILPPVVLLYYLLFFTAGIGGAACTAMPYAVAISGFFDGRRGLALGIVVAGSGLGATFGPQVAERLTSVMGWRGGFIAIGLFTALVSVLGLVFLVRTPRAAVSTENEGSEVDRQRRSRLWRSRELWMIMIAIAAASVATFGGMASLVPKFRDASMPSRLITSVLSFAGLASWIARPVVGYLLDKIFAPILCALIFGLAALGLMILIFTVGPTTAYAGAALVAMALGAEADLVTFLVSRYFRLIDFSRVVGLVWVIWAWGGGVGTAIAAQAYVRTQSYDMAFALFAGFLILAAVVIAFIGPYLNPVERRHDQSAAARASLPAGASDSFG